MAERKYALTKVDKGDYLLPSNDRATLWRIAVYVDGPSSGLTDWPKDKTLWGLWRFIGRPVTDGLTLDLGDLDWGEWECVEQGFATRQDAIDEAIRVTRP